MTQPSSQHDPVLLARKKAKAIAALGRMQFLTTRIADVEKHWCACNEFYVDYTEGKHGDLQALPTLFTGMAHGRRSKAQIDSQEFMDAYGAGFMTGVELQMLKESIDQLYTALDEVETVIEIK